MIASSESTSLRDFLVRRYHGLLRIGLHLMLIGICTLRAGIATANDTDADHVVPLPPFADLSTLLDALPGVVVQNTQVPTPNANLVVHGDALSTEVRLDGLRLAHGANGLWNAANFPTSLFNRPNIDGSVIDFQPNANTGEHMTHIVMNVDRFGDTRIQATGTTTLFHGRMSLRADTAFSSSRGPWDGALADHVGQSSALNPDTTLAPNLHGLSTWSGALTSRRNAVGDVARAQYRASSTTMLSLEHIGSFAHDQPQGARYASYDGMMRLNACALNGTFQPTLATCTAQATFTAPSTFASIGTSVPANAWYPNGRVTNAESTFGFALHSHVKENRLTFRASSDSVIRAIDGSAADLQPGNGGAWYAVTSSANCEPYFLAPGSFGAPATGAVGPCFGPNASVPFIGSTTTRSTVFPTTTNAPTCTSTPPFTCFTTPTALQNNGLFGYGSPLSQIEVDRSADLSLELSHESSRVSAYARIETHVESAAVWGNDPTAAATGCTDVIGSVTGARSIFSPLEPGVANTIDDAGIPYQPTCQTANFASNLSMSPLAAFDQLPRTPIVTPLTVIRESALTVGGTIRPQSRTQISFGDRLSLVQSEAHIEDPAVIATYAARGNAAAAPVDLDSVLQRSLHTAPYLNATYALRPSIRVQASLASGLTLPPANALSGLANVALPNALSPNYVATIPNPHLVPETRVQRNVRLTFTAPHAQVWNIEGYDNTVHDAFLAEDLSTPPVAGIPTFPSTQFYIEHTVNAGRQQVVGIDLTTARTPHVGFGYAFNAGLMRASLDGEAITNMPNINANAMAWYTSPNAIHAQLGLRWLGANNPSGGPGYRLLNGNASLPISRRVQAFVSGDNLLGASTGTQLGRTLTAQGNIVPTLTINPTTGLLTSMNAPQSLQELPAQTVSLGLRLAL